MDYVVMYVCMYVYNLIPTICNFKIFDRFSLKLLRIFCCWRTVNSIHVIIVTIGVIKHGGCANI